MDVFIVFITKKSIFFLGLSFYVDPANLDIVDYLSFISFIFYVLTSACPETYIPTRTGTTKIW